MKNRNSKINICTSVDDLTTSFRLNINYSVSELEAAIVDEQNYLNRKSVIKLLNRAIRYKKMGAKHL